MTANLCILLLALQFPRWSEATDSKGGRSRGRGEERGESPSKKVGCRFVSDYDAQSLAVDPEKQKSYIEDVLQWEKNFYAGAGVAYDPDTGMTYDGSSLNADTGALTGSRPWSAASKESLHLNLLTHALQPGGAEGSSSFDLHISVVDALDVLTKKITTIEEFNFVYPGYGGWLPWFCSRGRKTFSTGQIACRDLADKPTVIAPTWDWDNKVPALDNGQLAWAVHALVHVLHAHGSGISPLAERWSAYFDLLKSTCVDIFYHGLGHGYVRTVVRLHNMTAKPTRSNFMVESLDGKAESATLWLSDPYEGELMVLFMDLFGDWSAYPNSQAEKDLIWKHKRKQVVSVNYMDSVSPVTVQQGFWFSSHEQWKLLVLPYLQLAGPAKVFENGERARLADAALRKVPGLFASVNEPQMGTTDVSQTACKGYCSGVGVQQIAINGIVTDDVVTPYAAFPAMLVDLGVGLAWHRLMLAGPRMQSQYGSVESVTTNGSFIAPVLSWDAKVTSVLAMLGGMANLAQQYMEADGIYERFSNVITELYDSEFPEATSEEGLAGKDVPFFLPVSEIPLSHADFHSCAATALAQTTTTSRMHR